MMELQEAFESERVEAMRDGDEVEGMQVERLGEEGARRPWTGYHTPIKSFMA